MAKFKSGNNAASNRGPNKVTTEVKKAILAALDEVGGIKYLAKLAKEDSKSFCTLLVKCVPNEIAGKLQTEDVTLRDDIVERIKARNDEKRAKTNG